jgi:DNA-binding CsgD family transcriptional regulator
MKQSNALAYLRQLCCSGLSKEIVILEFLRAVQTVLPSCNNSFAGINDQIIPTYHMLDFEVTDIDEPVIIANYLTLERRNSFIEWFRGHTVLADARIIDESFYMSDLYNQVLRGHDQHHNLHSLVRQQGKPVGMLTLFRPRQQKPFNSREQMLCSQLLPYVSHALQVSGDENIQYSEKGLSGMIILNTQGAIIYLSQEAKSLLALVSQPVLSVDVRIKETELLAKLAQLCRNLEAVFRGQAAAPPSWSYTGPNGRFVFRAYWLDKQNNEPGGLVGMTLEHQEPVVLKILRAMKNLPLSPTQKEVAMLLAQGFSNEKIGERLHIKLTTVKDHIGKIFTKLDIHRREELLPKLLALEDAIQIVKVL